MVTQVTQRSRKEKTYFEYDNFSLGTLQISIPSKSARRRSNPLVTSYNFLSNIASESLNGEIKQDLFSEKSITGLVTAGVHHTDEFLSNR